jgi:biotin carboxylase
VSTALIVLPSGTYRAGAFVEAAHSMNLDVIIASDAATSLENERYLHIDLDDPRRSAEAIANSGHRVDAVIGVDDRSVMTAAMAAELIGVRHSAPAAVAATLNKAMLRRRLASHRVPQPAFELAAPHTDLVAIAEYVGTPVVLKPLSLSGGVGVIRVDHPLQAPPEAERIRRILAAAGENPNEPILVERYVPGEEVAVEGVVDAGRLTVLAIFDKPEQTSGPYFEETMLVTPSRLHPEVLNGIERITADAVRAIGLTEGPIHAELRIDGAQIAVIEVAARSIGGLCSKSLHFGLLGVTLERLLLRQALGLPIDSRRAQGASGVLMLPVPRTGLFTKVEGLTQAGAIPGITEITIAIPEGTPVRALPDTSRYVGFVFANSSSTDTVTKALRAAQGALRILIDEPAQ